MSYPMPLLDHFQPPVSSRKSWEGFHNMWASQIVMQLNQLLPFPYESEPQIHLGSQIEIDVATLEPEEFLPTGSASRFDAPEDGGVVTLPQIYVPPTPILTGEVEIEDPDTFEVLIYRDTDRWKLAAAIELVSPANKDRESTRRAFATKCLGYLAKGVSVITIDLVTNRDANLHADLIETANLPDDFDWSSETGLTVISYRTVRCEEATHLEVWPEELRIGSALPTIPLWLAADLAIPLELESSYRAACKALKLA